MVSAFVLFLSYLRKSWPSLAALLLMGSLVCLLLPNMVVTLDDDFWYLRSVIKTFQKGRPWTDEWLTPWAASASTISALLFKLTGSFHFAIHGQLAASAGLAAMGCTVFLKRQGISSLPALAAPMLLLATPTVLFMFLMFTGVALYMACLWWCLVLADRRQWLWFLVPWALAVASRQSAVAWLALPGWALLTEAWNHRRWLPRTPATRHVLTLFAAAAAVVLLCKFGMNPTGGQKLVAGHVGTGLFSAHAGVPLTLGLLAFLAGLGVASLVRLPRLWKTCSFTSLSRQRLLASALLAGAGAGGAFLFRAWSQNTHACYNDAFSGWLFPLLGAALGATLAFAVMRPRGDATLAALGSCLLVALYGGRFDYYFIDALCFGIAAGFPFAAPLGASAADRVERPDGNTLPCQDLPPAPAPPRTLANRIFSLRPVACALIIVTGTAAACWHARSAVRLAAQQAHSAAIILLYEQAIRTGKLAPENVGMGTFGYLGWMFQDYYAAHDGKTAPALGGFSRYAQHWAEGRGTGIITTLPRSLRPWRNLIPTRNTAALRDTPGVPVVHEIRRPFFGHTIRYTLFHGPSAARQAGSLSINPTLYGKRPFPLNDEEWRQLIYGPPL